MRVTVQGVQAVPASLGAMAARKQLGDGGADDEATVSWTEDGVRRSLVTPTPTLEVQRLAERFGGEVPELAVSRPSLEDTYLALIAPHVSELAPDSTGDTTRKVPA